MAGPQNTSYALMALEAPQLGASAIPSGPVLSGTPFVPTAAMIPPNAPTPVAPPASNAAPSPKIVPAQLLSPVGALSVSQPASDLHQAYDVAVSKGDPESMYSLANRAKGTPYEMPIRRAAETLDKRVSEFTAQVAPIQKAGGVATPEGKLQAGKVYEEYGHQPDKKRAFFEWLLGNPNFRVHLTGGDPQTKITYDTAGKPIEYTQNQFGKTIEVMDMATGQKMTRAEAEARGVLFSTLDNALKFQQEKTLSAANTQYLAAENEALGATVPKAPVNKALAQELNATYDQLTGKDLPPEERLKLYEFSNRQLKQLNSLSSGLDKFEQYLDNKSVGVDVLSDASVKQALNAIGITIGADGTARNSANEKVTKDMLKNLRKTFGSSEGLERMFAQDAETFKQYQYLKNLGAEPSKLLSRTLDLQDMLSKDIEAAKAKYGTQLPFLVTPKNARLGDEFQRGASSALMHEFNQDALTLYADWRKEQLKVYKGKAPDAGELAQAFTRTPEYKSLKDSYMARNRQVLARPVPESRTEYKPGAAALGLDVTPAAAPIERPTTAERTSPIPAAQPAKTSATPAATVKNRSIKETQPQSPSSRARDLAKQFGGRD